MTRWKVKPYLIPERDDDPMGVFIIKPAANKLSKQYFNAVTEEEVEAVHKANRALANQIVREHNLVASGAVEAMREALIDAHDRLRKLAQSGRIKGNSEQENYAWDGAEIVKAALALAKKGEKP
jgi:predicted TIM-barrel fold metal-dependent hydrolase